MEDLWQERRRLEPVVAGGRARRSAVRRMAELSYLLGDYERAEALARSPVLRTLIRYQRNEYEGTPDVRMPLAKLMRSFGAVRPYRPEWDAPQATLPFVQSMSWELPRVAIVVDGVPLEAQIDTGGDMLTLPAGFGVEPVVRMEGRWAGGVRGAMGYGRVGAVRLGEVTLRDVPVTVAGHDRAIVGTGLLRQFTPTLDYPGARLVLRPPVGEASGGIAVPFALALTHLLVVRGSLAGRPGTFLVDSGLEDDRGAALTAPARTLRAAGIAIPPTRPETGSSGAGQTTLKLGRFPAGQVAVGGAVQEGVLGLYGAFPKQLRRAAGFPIHALVSHHFLRRYVWTIDFTAMTMYLRSTRTP